MHYQQFQLLVKTKLLHFIRSLPKKIWLKASYISQGKKLRSNLMYKVADTIGSPPKSLVLPAAVLELIHTITILHDDVIDNTERRRGDKTIHTTYKKRVSISSGDYLLSKTLEALAVNSVPAVKEMFFEKVNDVCLGEIQQDINTDFNQPLSIEDCLEIARRKTGALFAISYQIPGIMSGLTGNSLKYLEELGYLHGTIYQLLDDYNDILFDSRIEKNNITSFKHWTITSVLWQKEEPNSFSEYVNNQDAEMTNQTQKKILAALEQVIADTYKKGMEKLETLDSEDSVQLNKLISLFKTEIAPFSPHAIFSD